MQPAYSKLEDVAHLDEALNTAPCGFLTFTDNGQILAVNATLLQLLGYELDELRGQHINLILPLSSRIFYQSHFFPLLKLHGHVEEIYISLRSKQGKTLPVLLNAVSQERSGVFINDCIFVLLHQRIQYEDELIVAKKNAEAAIHAQNQANAALQQAQIALESKQAELLDTVAKLEQEITRRQQVEASLRSSSARFRRIFDSNMIGICFWNIDGEIEEVNDAFLNIIGYSRNEFFSKNVSWVELTPPEYSFSDQQALDEIALKGINSPYEKEYIRADGSRVPILIGGSLLEGYTDRCVSFILDITQRIEDERKLQQWADIFQHTSQGLVITTPDNEPLELINPAFALIHGYTVEELIGRSFTSLIAPKCLPDVLEHIYQSLGQNYYSFETQHIRKDGTIFPVFVEINNVTEPSGEISYIIVNIQDITERKQAEKEILNSLQKATELNELKSHFITLISHEFRTPLTVILSSTQLLQHYSHKLSDSRKQKSFQQIETAIKRLTQLLEDVLVINKAEAENLELTPAPINLENFCHQLITEMQLTDGNKHQILFTHTGECFDAVMDEKVLSHILTNLLSNALKYSPDSKDIEFELSCQNQQATFKIKDYGIGIPSQDFPKLFEAFHRAYNIGNIPGVGVGLFIAKKMVDLHQGSINCISKVGIGTTFTVTIPWNCQENK